MPSRLPSTRPSRLASAPMLNGPADWPKWYAHVIEAAWYYGVNAFFTTRDTRQWSSLQHELFERLWEDIFEKLGDDVFAVVQSAGDMHHWGLWDIIRACCDEGFEHFVGQPLIDKYRDGDFVGMVCDCCDGLTS